MKIDVMDVVFLLIMLLAISAFYGDWIAIHNNVGWVFFGRLESFAVIPEVLIIFLFGYMVYLLKNLLAGLTTLICLYSILYIEMVTYVGNMIWHFAFG